MKRLVVVLAVVVAVTVPLYLGFAMPVAAEEPAVVAHAAAADGEYTGAKAGCRKCHLKQYRSWEKTPHAKTLEALPEDERSNPECLRCHTTGFGEPTGFTSVDATPELAFVGCEQCHGPGSGYRDKEIMQDHEASAAAGLRIPDEQTCLGCHNDESPQFSGSFDYEEMKAMGLHDMKKKS